MNKFAKVALFFVVALLIPMAIFAADPVATEAAAPAAEAVVAAPAATSSLSLATIGAGLILLAAGYGISKIGSHAVDSIARQPEAAGSIQTAMIISEALIEGVAFFALIICLLK